MSKKIYESGEDYLETILILHQRNGAVRSIDIVREMELSKPSVSRAVGILKNGGYITVDDNGYINFTDEGKQIAETIYERHRVFTDWLIWLGVSPDVAAQDACRLEHAISHESFEKLKQHIEENNEINHKD